MLEKFLFLELFLEAVARLGEERSCSALLYIPFSSPWLIVALKSLG